MAKITQQTLVITVSQMVRDSDPEVVILTDDVIAQLEAVISELAGEKSLVEIDKA